jgi:protein-tyrosine-phosphatase
MKILLQRIVPHQILQDVRAWRKLDPLARRIYFHCRLGGCPQRASQIPRDTADILFVCHGNIMRSAFAAALLRQRVQEAGLAVKVQSAGVHACRGKSADPRCVEAATKQGLNLRAHQAEPLTPELLDASGVIIAMDYLNYAEVTARHPHVTPRVFMMAGERDKSVQITDPYDGDPDDARRCFALLTTRVDSLAAILTHGANRKSQIVPGSQNTRAVRSI